MAVRSVLPARIEIPPIDEDQDGKFSANEVKLLGATT